MIKNDCDQSAVACIWAALLFVAYGMSFFLPAYFDPAPKNEIAPGWFAWWLILKILIDAVGTAGFPAHTEFWELIIFSFGWLPNILFPLGMVYASICRWREAEILGIAATLTASVWLVDLAIDGSIQHLGPGYYLWLFSMILLASTGLFGSIMRNPEPASQ